MKYLILMLGLILIGFFFRDDLKEQGGYGDIGFIVPVFFWMVYIIIWLLVFFAFNVELPKITI